MELKIKNPNNLELLGFIENFLIEKIKEYFISNLNPVALIPIENYINSPEVLNTLKLNPEERIHISIKTAAIVAISNLVISQSNNDYIIRIDSDKDIPKITAKLIDIAQLINYGSMGSPAYPIFDETFDYAASHFSEFYEEYIKNVP